MITKTPQVNQYHDHDILVGESPKQVPGQVHSSKEREEVQLVRLETLHVEEGVAAAVESDDHVEFLVEDHTRRAAAGTAVDVEVV